MSVILKSEEEEFNSLTKLKNDFKKVLYYSQHIDETEELPEIDNIFKEWYIAKRKFRKFFTKENNFICNSKIKLGFPLCDETKAENFTTFLKWIRSSCLFDLYEYVKFQGQKAFFENKVKENYIYKEHSITKNTKLLKSFKYFIEDKNLLTEIQNYASRIIQEDKIEGELCLSINPLDYLSISENQHGWRSCHALDGEYRAGNLSYIMDSSTIIAYIKSKDDVILPHFPTSVPWNNKKWRVLLYCAEDRNFIFAGKQYPYELPQALQKVKDILYLLNFFPNGEDVDSPFFSLVEISDWSNDYIESFTRFGETRTLDQNYLVSWGKIFPISDVIKDEHGSCHYNDVLFSSTYTRPYYAYTHWDYSKFAPLHFSRGMNPILVGASTRCLKCGTFRPNEDSMFCGACNDDIKYKYDNTRCFGCGKIIEQSGYQYSHHVYCKKCYNEMKRVEKIIAKKVGF